MVLAGNAIDEGSRLGLFRIAIRGIVLKGDLYRLDICDIEQRLTFSLAPLLFREIDAIDSLVGFNLVRRVALRA